VKGWQSDSHIDRSLARIEDGYLVNCVVGLIKRKKECQLLEKQNYIPAGVGQTVSRRPSSAFGERRECRLRTSSKRASEHGTADKSFECGTVWNDEFMARLHQAAEF
jgi:hypothetical protein